MIICWVFFAGLFSEPARTNGSSSLQALLPPLPGWFLTEVPRTYVPGTLFEYINGAAESYLSYGFRELLVADYKRESAAATLTVEIYDMDKDTQAFGIYGAERYPGSRFLKIGNQGYEEDGTLNFIVGRFYVKLLCFSCGPNAEETLSSLARQIETRVKEKGRLPRLFDVFPPQGRIAYSEKFVLQNVLGYGFLHDGYIVSFRVNGQEFEAFILEGKSEQEAAEMLARFLENQKKVNQVPERADFGYHLRDRYMGHVYLALKGNYLLGIMRIKDGSEGVGVEYLNALRQGIKN
jgi:hypothetical protein